MFTVTSNSNIRLKNKFRFCLLLFYVNYGEDFKIGIFGFYCLDLVLLSLCRELFIVK